MLRVLCWKNQADVTVLEQFYYAPVLVWPQLGRAHRGLAALANSFGGSSLTSLSSYISLTLQTLLHICSHFQAYNELANFLIHIWHLNDVAMCVCDWPMCEDSEHIQKLIVDLYCWKLGPLHLANIWFCHFLSSSNCESWIVNLLFPQALTKVVTSL